MSKNDNISRGSVAEEFAEQTKEISIAEFFEKNKQMLGFDSKSRAIVTAVKEGTDNALDATEEAGFLPEIELTISEHGDYYQVVIEDNGPGITEDEIPKIFGKLLYGSRFATRAQTRGQQGIGISAAVLYAQNTTGYSATVTSKPENSETATKLDVRIDTETNNPRIENKENISWNKEHGTRIELIMDANMRGRKQLHRYIKDTALANPHATIRVSEPKWEFESERVTDELPPETEEILPHPHGIEVGILREMIDSTTESTLNNFLQNDFCKVGQTTSKRIRDAFKDYEYGRPLKWSTDIIFTPTEKTDPEQDTLIETDPESELHETIEDAVYGKSAEATEQFAECIISNIQSNDRVSYYDISEIVSKCASNVEDDTDVRLGETVREKTISSVWEFVSESRLQDLTQLISTATSDRKTQQTVSCLAKQTLKEIEDSSEFDTVTIKELKNIVENASDYAAKETDTAIGSTARDNVYDELYNISQTHPDKAPSLSELRNASRGSETLKNLQNAMKETKVNAPSTKCLSPMTEEKIEDGLRNLFDAEFYSSTQRDGEVYKGSPFIVEVGIAYGDNIGSADEQIDLRRFANRVPLVYKQGACSITNVTENIDWRNYKLKQSGGTGTLPRGNMALMVHIASTNVPFNSKSKDSIAGPEVIEQEIERAIRSSARDLKKYLKKQRSLREKERKRQTIGDVLPPMAQSLAKVSKRDAPDTSRSVARIMNTILIESQDNSLVFKNFSTTSETLSLTYNDTETEITLDSEEVYEIEKQETTIKNINSQKVTIGQSAEETVKLVE